MERLRFEAKDSFDIRDRGRVFTGVSPWTEQEPKALVGREVEIDGEVYTIKGIETDLMPWGIRAGESVGVLV